MPEIQSVEEWEEDIRKAYSTKCCYKYYLTNWIVPRWGEYTLPRIENGIAVFVEDWLATISTKPRNQGEDPEYCERGLQSCHPLRLDENEPHPCGAAKR
jgi:hypothetical protein